MRAIVLVCLSVLVCIASARSIGWTGAAGNGLWNFANNWDANAVPTSSDDVTINVPGGTIVSVSAPAAANSISIGGSTQFAQTLNILSSLAVGNGGITVQLNGTLQISGNNDLPLSSTGPVTVGRGGTLNYASGAVSGPGQYVIQNGGGLIFSTPALKLLSKANFTVWGGTTIQSTTIQFAGGSGLYLLGTSSAHGQINIFSTDTAANIFYVSGNFTYQGAATTSPLNFQVPTTFTTPLFVQGTSGITVTAQVTFSDVFLPIGSTLTVQAGLANTYFRSVQGNGTFFVNSIADVGFISNSVLNIAASGSLTSETSGTVKSLVVGGKLVQNAGTLSATDLSIVAGTISGNGVVHASGNTEIVPSSGGNTNSFISTEVQVAGKGYTTNTNNVLFSTGGNLHILSTGSFTINAANTFSKQQGNPVVTNEVNLPAGAVFTTSVDFNGGSGVLVLSGGLVIWQGDKTVANKVTTASVLVEFATAVVAWGPVSGTGSINITANPSGTSVSISLYSSTVITLKNGSSPNESPKL